MSYMVVGGCGFVGSHLVDSLIANGAEKVVVVDNMHLGTLSNVAEANETGKLTVYREDARYVTTLENIIDKEQPEVVFNLAVKCLPYGFIDPEGSFMVGVEIAQNLANLLRKHKYSRLVHFSSSESYGSAKTVPMREDHPLDPTTPYGAGKAAADLLLLSYHKLFGLDVSIVRPFNLYGPRQNMDAYAAVIPVTINRIIHGEAPIIQGDGLQSRDFTFVKDVTNAVAGLVDNDCAVGRIVNLGQGSELTIKHVIEFICDRMFVPHGKIKYVASRLSDVKRLYADVSLAKALFGYSPKTKFMQGIDATIDWLLHRKTVGVCEVTKLEEVYV